MTLTELLARVEAATGPDRELDGDVFFHVDPRFPPGTALRMSGLPDPATFATGAYTSVKAPPYTASIDAVVTLIERKLPGWAWDVERLPDDEDYIVNFYHPHDQVRYVADKEKLALALLAGLLKALIATSKPAVAPSPRRRASNEQRASRERC